MKDEILQKKRQENQKEDRKRMGRFALYVCIGGVVGFILGFLGSHIVTYLENEQWDFASFGRMLTEVVGLAGRYLLIGGNLIALPAIWIRFIRHKKEALQWDGEDEVFFEKVDQKLSMDLTISSALTIFEMFAYGIAFYGLAFMQKKSAWLFFADLLFFLGSLFGVFFCQKCIVNLLKEMNPEKQGSVFDRKFTKVWFASCDEAERQKIGEASYKTYLVMTLVYQVCSMVLMIAGFFFPIGMLPFVIVCLLWLVQTLLYSLHCR